MMTLPHTDYIVKRTFDYVMMICKITEDDHSNDYHHYLRYDARQDKGQELQQIW